MPLQPGSLCPQRRPRRQVRVGCVPPMAADLAVLNRERLPSSHGSFLQTLIGHISCDRAAGVEPAMVVPTVQVQLSLAVHPSTSLKPLLCLTLP